MRDSCSFRPLFVALLVMVWAGVGAWGKEVIPPAPGRYVNDYAGVMSSGAVGRLNVELEAFEKQTSNQLVVAVFPKMQSDSSVEDYSTRVFEAWKVGQKGKDNGVVLFVYVQDRKTFAVTGYGLEGALPDSLLKGIIDGEITPAFRRGDFDAGVTAGVRAMMQATRGEYRGTGRTVAQGRGRIGGRSSGGGAAVAFFVLLFIGIAINRAQRATMYGRRGRRYGWYPPPTIGYGGGWGRGGWGGGGSWGGGGGFGGGGGGFSGGGGRTGGGGAGGSW